MEKNNAKERFVCPLVVNCVCTDIFSIILSGHTWRQPMASQHLKVSVEKLNATCTNPKPLFSKKDMDETKTAQAPVFTASLHR